MSSIDIDFSILPLVDPYKIVVADTSDWGHIEDKPAIIEILMPGEENPITHYFDKRAVNIFNSYNLGLNCEGCGEDLHELPDGIYHFTVKGSPDKYNRTRQFLRTFSTQVDFDEIVAGLDLTCNKIPKEIHELVGKIRLFLSSAESNTRLGNYCKAQESLFKAQKLIGKLKGCNSCV